MKKNILFSCYACEPQKGSEPGVGWNVPYHVANVCPQYNVFLLTKGTKREKIEAYLKSRPIPNLHCLYYDLPNWMKVERFGFGNQYNYLLWQWLVKYKIKEWDKQYHFDLIHHVTFNQYRTPSPGFFMNIPFVMGPIGGAETINRIFFQDLSKSTQKKEEYRQKGTDFKLFQWLNTRTKNKKIILFSSVENQKRLKPFCGLSKSSVLPAIAFSPSDFPESIETKGHSPISTCFEMTYAGRPSDWKGLLIFLRSAKRAFTENEIHDFKIRLIGIRNKEEQTLTLEWIKEQGLQNYVELIPFIPRMDLLKTLQTCNLFVYPAFRDSGSMSVLEASALGCPTICFDTGGQDAFPDNILLKVQPLNDYNKTVNLFAEKLLWSYRNREKIAQIGIEAKNYVYKHLTWEQKAKYFNGIYQELLK